GMLRETTAGGNVAYAAQRPKTCAYAGSAVGLKARSHPSGTFPGRDLVGDAVGPLVRWTFCSRSPLRVRSTKTTTARSSLATLGPFTAQNAAAVTQLTNSAAAVALRSKENTRHMCLSPTALAPRLRRVRGARVCERDHAHRMRITAAVAAVAETDALVVRPQLGAAGVPALGCARDRCVGRRRRWNESDNGSCASCSHHDDEHGLEHLGPPHDRLLGSMECSAESRRPAWRDRCERLERLRNLVIGHGQDHDLGADGRAPVKVDHILIQHPYAAARYVRAD